MADIILSLPDQHGGFAFKTTADLAAWITSLNEFEELYKNLDPGNESEIYLALHKGHEFRSRWRGKVPLSFMRKLRLLELEVRRFPTPRLSDEVEDLYQARVVNHVRVIDTTQVSGRKRPYS